MCLLLLLIWRLVLEPIQRSRSLIQIIILIAKDEGLDRKRWEFVWGMNRERARVGWSHSIPFICLEYGNLFFFTLRSISTRIQRLFVIFSTYLSIFLKCGFLFRPHIFRRTCQVLDPVKSAVVSVAFWNQRNSIWRCQLSISKWELGVEWKMHLSINRTRTNTSTVITRKIRLTYWA